MYIYNLKKVVHVKYINIKVNLTGDYKYISHVTTHTGWTYIPTLYCAKIFFVLHAMRAEVSRKQNISRKKGDMC